VNKYVCVKSNDDCAMSYKTWLNHQLTQPRIIELCWKLSSGSGT